MRQTRKSNQWSFGMKAHLRMDSRPTLIHSVAATAANVYDSQMLPELLQGQETREWGDAAILDKTPPNLLVPLRVVRVDQPMS
jgi:transposase, IS5 family